MLTPSQTNQHIASFLDCDLDICRFCRICQSTYNAVDADNCSFWRRRFLEYFEKPGRKTYPTNATYKFQYQRRKLVFKFGATFKAGETKREIECLEVLRDLICGESCSKGSSLLRWLEKLCSGRKILIKPSEAFSGVIEDDTTYESANLAHLHRFITAGNLLTDLFRPEKSRNRSTYNRDRPLPKPAPLLQTTQVLCAPLLLSFDSMLIQSHYGFPDSQLTVYSAAENYPIFIGCNGLDVNMEFVLHNINFWKYHMVRETENTLFRAFEALDPSERPRWWTAQLQQGVQKLGKHWKGSYAYVDRPVVETIRHSRSDNDQVQDLFAGEENDYAFQDMSLELVNDGSMPWPPAFEKILRSLTLPSSRAKTRAQKRSAMPEDIANFKPLSFRFDGGGQDATEEFLASGWLNPLPPQSGVPGWHRMTMMKYFEDDDTGIIDTEALWAYEGVVLPGGQIVLGRWWSPDDGTGEDMYSGPFILWCVDGPQFADDEEGTEVDGEDFGNGGL